jgi:hypothetical protein
MTNVILPNDIWHIFTNPYNKENIKFKHTGKAIPSQTLTGPEGSRRLRLPDFMTIGT